MLAPRLIEIERVDYSNARHGTDVLTMLDLYARDPMGGGTPLSESTRTGLLIGLAETPNAFSLLAYVEGNLAGLANCFFGFSTFAAKPLVNIHDIVVDARFRGRGVGRALFEGIEAIAAKKGACKVTLEVLDGNGPAKALYASLGYGDYELDPAHGKALFWQKKIEP